MKDLSLDIHSVTPVMPAGTVASAIPVNPAASTVPVTPVAAAKPASPTPCPSNALPLSMMRIGDRGTVVMCRATEKLLHQLECLGLVEGSEVHVISEHDGNLIIELKDSRLALSRGMANHLMVTLS